MNFKQLFYITLLFLIASCTFEEKTDEVVVEDIPKIKYRIGEDDTWKRAIIPESIQEALKRDTLISNLFFRDVFSRNSWTDTLPIQFRSVFRISENIKNYNYELYFEKIVGNAKVYFNDSLLFESENMFISWKVDVTDIVKRGKNFMYIEFQSLEDAKKNAQLSSSINFPYNGYEMLRMAHYFIDTTIGVHYVPMGLMGQVKITKWSKAKIQDVKITTQELKYNESATINIKYLIEARSNISVDLQVFNGFDLIENRKVNLSKGTNEVNFKYLIDTPKLWWTHDVGDPYLYKFTTKMFYSDVLVQEKENNFGIRNIEIDTSDNSFKLYLNGKQLPLKIINYLPLSYFFGKITPDRYMKVLTDVVSAGINMLHVESRGIYERNIFYDQCDEKGVLIWQDFMLPYTIIDTSNNFFDKIEQEAITNIQRLKNHASIAFWAGNSSKAQTTSNIEYSYSDSIFFRKNNNYLFKVLLKNAVSKYDSGTIYFEKMPLNNFIYVKNDLPSCPSILSIRKVTSQGDRNLDAKMMKNYQKPYNSNEIIFTMFKSQNINVTDFSGYVYASQAVAYNEFNNAIKHTLKNEKRDAVVFGRYIDLLPLVSNALVDNGGYWKGGMYALSENLKNFVVFIDEQNGNIDLSVLSNLQENINVDIYLKLYDFEGKVYWRKNFIGTNIKKQQLNKYFDFNLFRELKKIGKNNATFKIEVFYNQELFYENYYMFAPDKNLNLKSPNINMKYFTVDEGYVIELTTNYFARHVYIYTEKNGRFSENFVDIAPGETKKIYFYTPNDIYAIEGAFKTIDYSQISEINLFSF